MMQTKTKRRMVKGLVIMLTLYFTGGLALWLFQDSILLHPKKLDADYVFNFTEPFKEEWIQVTDKKQLHFVRFFPSANQKKKGFVLYFHGNRNNITRYADYASNFTKEGYEVWMPDYPGFGKTTGTFSEDRIYKDANILYNLLSKEIQSDQIIIYGRSLGTGVASQLASLKTCRRLILETPYCSIPGLFVDVFPLYPANRIIRFQFPVIEYLKKVKAPVTIFHGTIDEVIPFVHSIKLKSVLKDGDEFISIEKGRHNNLNDFKFFHLKLDSLLKLNG
jgi:alpha-beta hydrolase superfamily lysophospholipase